LGNQNIKLFKEMKYILFFILFFINYLCSSAQVEDSIFNAMKREEIGVYLVEKGHLDKVYLKMSFASEEVPDKSVIASLQRRKILQIDIIYTDYPKNRNFDKLNTNRVRKMLALIPDLGKRTDVSWRLIKQTASQNYQQAVKLFHGVAVTFVEEQVPATQTVINREIEKVKSYVFDGTFKDSVVYKVMERNKKNWKNVLVVGDWTGSIYPYSSQIVNWHKLHLKDGVIKHFVFFNDGDDKNDKDKRIGKTGGVYFTKTNEIMHVIEVMTQALQNGNGGDVPENDVEAILAGIEKYKDIESVVLIADNNSAVRDIRLTPQITKPVHVILCGVEGGRVSPQYVNLAKFTNGSIHTIEEDINHLAKMQANDILKIGSRIFRLKPNGFFMLVK
jgi:hypothetical protein